VTLDAITSAGVDVYFSSLDQDDVASSATNRSATISTAGDDIQSGSPAQIKTNTSAQIRSRMGVSGASDVLRITTLGYIDTRGRLAA
jgi:hypothetical protein